MSQPSSEYQVAFLANLQRILSEGGFVSTYKHALLRAIADLCVEIGDDSGAALVVPVEALAEKVIAYYWRQALPYAAEEGDETILSQNTGKQAEILRHVIDARRAAGGRSLARAKARRASWSSVVAKVARVVKKMPLWKLQRVGDGVLDFLYPNVEAGDVIELRPGVAFCFRRFHGLVEDLLRGAWVRFVRSLRENRQLLGDKTDLDEFLFGSERASLAPYVAPLTEVQGGACFYCDRTLGENPAVDHFIPWSRYPVDLAHNFVLAHGTCNGSKGDRLAAYEHLARWCRRQTDQGDALDRVFSDAGLVADGRASVRITRWAYEQVASTSGLVWVRGDDLVGLDVRWRELVGIAA